METEEYRRFLGIMAVPVMPDAFDLALNIRFGAIP